MDERIDILDSQGNPTSKSCLKSVAHEYGYFHATVYIWLYTRDEKVLLQKRAATKKVFLNLWDISVGVILVLDKMYWTLPLEKYARKLVFYWKRKT
tara:strand:+ start:164 stop:451 length:288 start_codon:yes stop_codon:yes gene_type:complete